MIEILLPILGLTLGIVLIAIFSDLAVKHVATLASILGVSSLIIGITIVSIGTDIPEIINSIISCSMGHGNIDVGDSVGSNLSQITLVFGLLPIICGAFVVKRKEIIIIGSCMLLSLILIFTVVEKGFFTRLDAFFMMASFMFYTLISYTVTKSDMLDHVNLMMEDLPEHRSKKFHAIIAIACFIGVAFSSYLIIQSVIELATQLNIHEYILSFFMVSIGTSLPELAVDVSALRRKQYNIAIGDIIGSCIVDSTISIAIGQFLFPQEVAAALAIPSILYAFIAAVFVILVVAKREKVDRKAGVLFIVIYALSFLLIPLFWPGG